MERTLPRIMDKEVEIYRRILTYGYKSWKLTETMKRNLSNRYEIPTKSATGHKNWKYNLSLISLNKDNLVCETHPNNEY